MIALIFLSLLLSVSLYLSSLLMPTYAWYGSLMFHAPLAYTFSRITSHDNTPHTPRFIHGFFWGILVFGTFFYYLGSGFIASTPHSPLPLLCFGTGLTAYFACYSGLWFWLTELCIRSISFFSHTNAYASTLIWLLSTCAYITWIDRYSLWPFLRVEGLPLLHPLISLTNYPALLQLLPIVGKTVLTLLLLAPGTGIALLAQHIFQDFTHGTTSRHAQKNTLTQKRHVLCAATLAITITIVTMHTIITYQSQKIKKSTAITPPAWLAQIAWLPLQGTGHHSLATIVQHSLKQIVLANPDIQLIITPESALYTDHLCNDTACTNLWDSAHLSRPVTIIAGSFSKIQALSSNQNKHHNPEHFTNQNTSHHTTIHNTCYLIHDGTLVQKFHKKHTVPFCECAPSWAQNSWLSTLFVNDLPAITPSQNKRAPLHVPGKTKDSNTTQHNTHQSDGTLTLVPYICSELFCNEYQDDYYQHLPILALINDTWSAHHCIAQLLLNTARFKAIQWQRSILYISYSYACSIDQHGTLHNLPSIQHKIS